MTNDQSGATLSSTDSLSVLTQQSITALQRVLGDETIPIGDRKKTALQVLDLVEKQRTAPTSQALPPLEHPPNPFNAAPAPRVAPPSIPGSAECNDTPAHAAPHATRSGKILSPHYFVIHDFLPLEDNQRALSIALENHHNFIPSLTTTPERQEARKSYSLSFDHFLELSKQLVERIVAVLPQIVTGIEDIPVNIEINMTAHGDGCFYKIHNDSGEPNVETRVLTFVYYFHQEPKPYSGGELRIYETDLGNFSSDPSDSFVDFTPRNNSIIFFDSRIKHEVLPISCPSQRFEDSRFSLNGWVRRPDSSEAPPVQVF